MGCGQVKGRGDENLCRGASTSERPGIGSNIADRNSRGSSSPLSQFGSPGPDRSYRDVRPPLARETTGYKQRYRDDTSVAATRGAPHCTQFARGYFPFATANVQVSADRDL